MPTESNPNNNKWIELFQKQYGRKPKILHIDNVANNGYQMAKMLNAAGCDCDVLCKDYYDVMACPEWDDADFTGDIGNRLFPNWKQANLHGFQRPRWFAQGPAELCIEYLIAYRKGETVKAAELWCQLEESRYNAAIYAGNIPTSPSANEQLELPSLKPKKAYNSPVLNLLSTIFRKLIFTLIHQPSYYVRYLKNIMVKDSSSISIPENKWEQLQLARKKQEQHLESIATKIQTDAQIELAKEQHYLAYITKKCESIRKLFIRQFPDRLPTIGETTASYIRQTLNIPYVQLFKEYDILMSHAADPRPFLCGMDNVVNAEYGAIRDLPYDGSEDATLILLAYANGKVLYTTNTDCFKSAQYITQYSGAKVVCGLHGLDIDRIEQKINTARNQICFDGRFGVDPSIPVLFFGGRHDNYRDKNHYIKGDELLFPALAKLLKEGYDFRLITTTFGHAVSQVKNLIISYDGLKDKIIWTPLLDKLKLYKCYTSVDIVLDQFELEIFGGVAIEALINGKAPLVSAYIPKFLLDNYFTESYPCYPCRTSEDIYLALKNIFTNPYLAAKTAEQGKKWVMEHHSNKAVVERCVKAFNLCIPLCQEMPE